MVQYFEGSNDPNSPLLKHWIMISSGSYVGQILEHINEEKMSKQVKTHKIIVYS